MVGQVLPQRIHLVGAVLTLLALLHGGPARAYSVLSHEAIIDATWDGGIEPVLREVCPGGTPEDMHRARAFAYGGAIFPDMGYYPFGEPFFSDLIHYVRTGDFVESLIDGAEDRDQLAFALGALAHLTADEVGHSLGINRAVPVDYPKLRARYHDVVTFAQDRRSHLRVEFGLDVLQVANGAYAPEAYHDLIGFEVSRPALERAFRETYGIALAEIVPNLDQTVADLRYTVSQLVPKLTVHAWKSHRDEIAQRLPGVTFSRYRYRIEPSDYRREWGPHKGPRLTTRLLGWLVRILPKVGPLKVLAFKPLSPEAQRLCGRSLDDTVDQYRVRLNILRSRRLELAEENLDTGRPTRAGEYTLADDAYARLARSLAHGSRSTVGSDLRDLVLSFFSDPTVRVATERNRKRWRETEHALERLRAGRPIAAAGDGAGDAAMQGGGE